MPEPTPEAWAQIRHAYEHTDRPIVDICAEHGITDPMLRYRVKRWGWHKRRSLIPREGPPAVAAMTLPLPACGERSAAGAERGRPGEGAPPETEDNESPPHPISSQGSEIDLSPHSSPDGERPLAYAGRGEESIVPRLQSAVARVLPAIEATIARLAAGPYQAREMEQAGRALSSLTRTLRELNALLAQHNARPAADRFDDDDMPEDIDEFRHALARRIRAFVESRTGPNSVVPGSALPPQK